MKLKNLAVWTLLPLLMLGCSGGGNPNSPASTGSPVAVDPMQDKGIGPVSSVALEPIDSKLAKTGEALFEAKCTACHKFDKRKVGPALGGVTARRTPEWIMNMVMNPIEMTAKDPIAKGLLAEYATQMAFFGLTETETRAILEYLRTKEKSNDKK